MEPLNPEASWSCNNKSQKPGSRCPGYTITATSMERLINRSDAARIALLTQLLFYLHCRISQELESIDSNNIRGLETFLQKYRNVLHPTHYLCLSAKLSLSQLYGKIHGYLIHELPDELLERKRDICKEIIRVFDVIEPGFTRLRGTASNSFLKASFANFLF